MSGVILLVFLNSSINEFCKIAVVNNAYCLFLSAISNGVILFASAISASESCLPSGTGGVFRVGEGCFKVEAPLFDPETVKPGDYYYPQEISEELLEECLKLQMEGVEQSAAYTRKLCEEYRNQ